MELVLKNISCQDIGNNKCSLTLGAKCEVILKFKLNVVSRIAGKAKRVDSKDRLHQPTSTQYQVHVVTCKLP